MSGHKKDKAPRTDSSGKSPTKFMEQSEAMPHLENVLSRDRYEEGSNSEVAELYADPRSDRDAEARASDETKILAKKAPKKVGYPALKEVKEVEDDEDNDDESQPGFQSLEPDQK